ncbi:hypothetical protein F2Q70_00018755 [Brassica cretica]|uniref:Uncharacterized protein n=1 Tax=Brassica cretica TaxID=69181 RepID=A0A3N6Q1S9_BRACR|nr:hypothetical protein F2Q70_00018755 [Brassica cretica]
MAITGHPGAYLHVEEAILLETLQLAFDLCLVLSKRGHDHIWDLGAAIARGPALEHIDGSLQGRA